MKIPRPSAYSKTVIMHKFIGTFLGKTRNRREGMEMMPEVFGEDSYWEMNCFAWFLTTLYTVDNRESFLFSSSQSLPLTFFSTYDNFVTNMVFRAGTWRVMKCVPGVSWRLGQIFRWFSKKFMIPVDSSQINKFSSLQPYTILYSILMKENFRTLNASYISLDVTTFWRNICH